LKVYRLQKHVYSLREITQAMVCGKSNHRHNFQLPRHSKCISEFVSGFMQRPKHFWGRTPSTAMLALTAAATAAARRTADYLRFRLDFERNAFVAFHISCPSQFITNAAAQRPFRN